MAKLIGRVARGATAAALVVSSAAFAAPVARVAVETADVPALRTEVLKPGLYRISGDGGSALLRVSTNGLIVVDSMRAGSYGPLLAEIRRVVKEPSAPIRALILTGSGRDQAGNVAQFIDAGVPVIVQRRAVSGLDGGRLAEGAPAARPPVVAYDSDYQLYSGDVVVEAEHVGSGRSRADSIVLFPDLRVVAVGELFTTETPKPDCNDGGSLAGWAAAIGHLLWSNFDVAVPSRGPPVGKRELAALKETLETMAEHEGDAAQQVGCRSAGVSR
jgi:hypothetical protein